MNVGIFWQTNLSTLIQKDYDFKAEIITYGIKLVIIFIDFIRPN